jgi:GxxExxY protein
MVGHAGSVKDTQRVERDPRTAAILAAAFEVHNTLGPGFEEVFYQRALHRELAARDLDVAREVEIEICYKGMRLGRKRVDFMVDDVMVEIKAKSAFEPQDFVQTLSYLRASGYQVSLLLNFGASRLEYRRLVNSHDPAARTGEREG